MAKSSSINVFCTDTRRFGLASLFKQVMHESCPVRKKRCWRLVTHRGHSRKLVHDSHKPLTSRLTFLKLPQLRHFPETDWKEIRLVIFIVKDWIRTITSHSCFLSISKWNKLFLSVCVNLHHILLTKIKELLTRLSSICVVFIKIGRNTSTNSTRTTSVRCAFAKVDRNVSTNSTRTATVRRAFAKDVSIWKLSFIRLEICYERIYRGRMMNVVS